MASKHTPGEWRAEFVGMSSAGDDGVDVYEVIELLADGYVRVAEHLTEADARLIAAAPELLKALQTLSDSLPSDEYMRAQGREPGPGLVMMRAAIAKATGETA